MSKKSVLVVIFGLFLIKTDSAYAASCTVAGDSRQIGLGQTATINFVVTNTSQDIITKIKVDNFDQTYVQMVGGDSLLLDTNIALSQSDSVSVQVEGLTLTTDYLELELSGSSDGNNFDKCSGNPGQITVIEPIETPSPTSTSTTTSCSTTITNTVINTITNIVTKIIKDETKPNLKILTEFKLVYEEAPLVEIISSDGTGIARIEYSVDGGGNWTPVDLEDNIGNKQITTNFTPNVVEDGDYSLVVKVTDTTGNKVQSKEVKFTIDRLPPRVGPLTVMAGPLIVDNGSGDNIDLIIGVEYRFILTSAGGPNKISMNCGDSIYDFFKNNDIGVWSAKIKFDKSGECIPEITAEDGAGNKQEIKSEELIINNLGKLQNATITVYWYDDYEKKFVKWDGEPYGQINPVNTSQSGGYSFLLPPGKYYLEVKSVGKRTAVSNIIETHETAYVNDDWELLPVWKFWQFRQEKQVNPKKLGNTSFQDVNFPLPKVSLNGLSTLNIRGKSSVVGLLPSWHPTTNRYLKTVDELFRNKVNVYPVLIQENLSSSESIKRRGGYNLNIYADPDGEMLQDINISGLPTTWIVNRFGQVVKVKVGEISYQEIISVINSIE